MSEGTMKFNGGVADGRELPVGAVHPDEKIQVRLTKEGEVWHIGHPYDAEDEGVQVGHYKLDKKKNEYMEVKA